MRDYLFDRARLLVAIVPAFLAWMVWQILAMWRERRDS
jgi:hypothetical protein